MRAINPLDNLPPEYPEDDLEGQVRAAVAASGRKLVVLDDDPTGVQTVHDIAVLSRWGVDELAAELERDAPAFFLLTNSRSLPETGARGAQQRDRAEFACRIRAIRSRVLGCQPERLHVARSFPG